MAFHQRNFRQPADPLRPLTSLTHAWSLAGTYLVRYFNKVPGATLCTVPGHICTIEKHVYLYIYISFFNHIFMGIYLFTFMYSGKGLDVFLGLSFEPQTYKESSTNLGDH